MVSLGSALADPGSEWLEILPTAPSRSSWDLGSWARALHLFQPRCQVKLLCCRLHKGEKRATKKVGKRETRNPAEGKGSEVGLEQADVVGRVTSAGGDHSMVGPLHTPGTRAGCASSPPEGNKKGDCIPAWNFTGNGGIALLLAGERGNFPSKSGSSRVKSSTAKSHCTQSRAFYE